MTQFSDLGLAEPLLRALQHEGYTQPTPIQAQAIGPVLAKRDLLGIAQTGTGKTAAFSLPILHQLLQDPARPAPKTVRALVLAPTRELALQITESFKAYGRFTHFSVACVLGGVAQGPQRAALARGLDILVATPGRLLDHMSQGSVRLDQTRYVVLDEADHMLDLGFIVPIKQIVAKLPKTRQTMFFSATMPKEIASLAAEMLHTPVRIAVTPEATTVERVTQEVFLIEGARKTTLLVELLKRPQVQSAIVFTRTKRGADRVSGALSAAGLKAQAIHGNKSQNQRQRALDDFKSGKTRVLVATDIAARGIDVDGVTHVVNFELPEVSESYVHRIGRTARAGKDGAAWSLVDNSERHLLRDIEKLTRQTLEVDDQRNPATRNLPEPAKEDARRPRQNQNRPQQARPQGQRPGGQGQRPAGNGQRPGAAGNRSAAPGGRNAAPGGAQTRPRHPDAARGDNGPRRDRAGS